MCYPQYIFDNLTALYIYIYIYIYNRIYLKSELYWIPMLQHEIKLVQLQTKLSVDLMFF